MKRKFLILFSAVLIFFLGCKNSEKDNVFVWGEIKNLPDYEVVKLIYREPLTAEVLDSVEAENGKFFLKGFLQKKGFLVVKFQNNDYPIFLVAQPKDSFKIFADYNNLKKTYTVQGNKESVWLQQLENRLAITDSLFQLYQKQNNRKKLDSLIRLQRYLNKNFVFKHPNSLVAIVALSQKLPDQSPVLNVYTDLRVFEYADSVLMELYPLDKNVLALHKFVLNKKVKFLRDANPLKTITLNQQAIDFDLTDINGKHLKLEDFKGKKVLIYFWASWSVESKNVFHFLNKLRKQFPNLVIIQYSIDINRKDFENFLKDKKYDWYQICDCKGWESNFIKNYKVEKIPSGVLIDENGKILGFNLSDDKILKLLSNG